MKYEQLKCIIYSVGIESGNFNPTSSLPVFCFKVTRVTRTHSQQKGNPNQEICAPVIFSTLTYWSVRKFLKGGIVTTVRSCNNRM